MHNLPRCRGWGWEIPCESSGEEWAAGQERQKANAPTSDPTKGFTSERAPEDRGARSAIRPVDRRDRGSSSQFWRWAGTAFSREASEQGGRGRGGPRWREGRSARGRARRAAFPGGFACPSLPPGSSERARERLPARAMALHVPKAPGFAQMLKEGAKVRRGGRESDVGLAQGCGGRSEGEGPACGPRVLPGRSGRGKEDSRKGGRGGRPRDSRALPRSPAAAPLKAAHLAPEPSGMLQGEVRGTAKRVGAVRGARRGGGAGAGRRQLFSGGGRRGGPRGCVAAVRYGGKRHCPAQRVLGVLKPALGACLPRLNT